MEPTTRRKWTLWGLILLGAAVFGVGIDWGLPSKEADRFLFADKTASSESTHAFRLSGAGIVKRLGNWDDDPSRPSDAAQHPITDRSKPITLLENQRGFNAQQIQAAGDPNIGALLDAEQQAWKKVSALRESHAEQTDEFESTGQLYLRAGDAVRQYVNQYDLDHIPGYTQQLEQDDTYRARLLMRYRLYSHQPDEMMTFRALGRMHPEKGDFDPRLYQYGGLWIYPVGGLLQLAGITGAVTLSPDLSYYLDNPDQFGRFYVIGRVYAALWGLIGILAVYQLARRWSGDGCAAAVAAICFIFMPVVIDLTHEANPNLPGAVLVLLALIAASNYLETGRTRSWLLASALCGAASAMMLTYILAFVLIPTMTLLRRGTSIGSIVQCLAGLIVAKLVYLAANPYVAIHFLHDRQLLSANLGRIEGMFGSSMASPSVGRALIMIAAGMGLPLAIAAAISLGVVSKGTKKTGTDTESPSHRGAGIMAFVAFVIFIPFALAAGEKSGDFARFGVFIDIALLLTTVIAVSRVFGSCRGRCVVGTLLIVGTIVYSIPYELGFFNDATVRNMRSGTASSLDQLLPDDTTWELGMDNEPAPYNCPPFDLYGWKVILMPIPNKDPLPRVVVRAEPGLNIWLPGQTPISWVNPKITISTPDAPGESK